jgi:hypothetical protein
MQNNIDEEVLRNHQALTKPHRACHESLVGTVTSLNGRAMSISDGYYVGGAIKISATGRQGLISRSIEISGHVEGDKMLLNVKKGNGTTYPAIAERMPMNARK